MGIDNHIAHVRELRKSRDVPGLVAEIARSKDESARLRIVVAELSRVADPRATSALIDLLRESQDDGVRAIAARTLSDLQQPAAAVPLIEALEDKSLGVRTWAAVGCGRLRCRDGLDRMAAMLNSSDWPERRAAAEALAEMGDLTAAKPLKAVRNQERRPLRRWRLSRALSRLMASARA